MRQRRLVLLSMSGVRIQDAELLSLGLTLPGFVERGRVIASLPSLGLLTLAAFTPPHWCVEYIDFDAEDEGGLVQGIVAGTPDVVAISSLTARIRDAYRIADLLRSSGITVLFGGLHASVLPLEMQLHADAVIVGEGETVWPQVLEDFEANCLQKIYRAPALREFAPDAPVPRYDLLDQAKYNRLTIQTTRGCPLDCSFCGASRLISRYKRKPHAAIRRELEAVTGIWPRPFVELADDNTFVHKRWSVETVRLLGEFGVKWFTETDVSVADDEELLDSLAESGCAQLLIGMEATSAAELGETDTHGWKRRRLSQYQAAIEKIQSRGISVNGCFVMGFDHAGPEVFERTARFVKESGLTEVQVTILTPFPGTALYERLRREGRLIDPTNWGSCTLFDVNFVPASMSVSDLRQGFRWLVAELYSESESAKRKSMFRSLVRQRY